MKSDSKRDIYMISIIGLIVAAGIFLVALASNRAKLVALPCGIMAVASIVWMIVFNPSNRLDSLKPSTKKIRLQSQLLLHDRFFCGLDCCHTLLIHVGHGYCSPDIQCLIYYQCNNLRFLPPLQKPVDREQGFSIQAKLT
jgi:hypothetical protein